MDSTLYLCNRSRYYVDFLDVVLFYNHSIKIFHQSLNEVAHLYYVERMKKSETMLFVTECLKSLGIRNKWCLTCQISF